MEYSLDQSALVECGFEVLTDKMCDSYPCRREVAAVVECNVDQSAVVDCGFTTGWGVSA